MDIKNVLNLTMGYAKKGIRVVGPIAVAAIYNRSAIQRVAEEIRFNGNVGYDDTIKAIVGSDMYSSDQCRAIDLLKVGETSEYYKAVVKVVRSVGYSSSKLAMIEAINKKV